MKCSTGRTNSHTRLRASINLSISTFSRREQEDTFVHLMTRMGAEESLESRREKQNNQTGDNRSQRAASIRSITLCEEFPIGTSIYPPLVYPSNGDLMVVASYRPMQVVAEYDTT